MSEKGIKLFSGIMSQMQETRGVLLEGDKQDICLGQLLESSKETVKDQFMQILDEKIEQKEMDLQYYFIDIGGVVAKRTEGFTEEDPEWGDVQGIVLYLTPSHVFENEHRHADWTDNAACDELKKVGFHAGELMEGILEFDLDTNIDALKKFLSDHPKFEENEEFGSFIRSFAEKN